MKLTFSDIKKANDFLAQYLDPTPLVYNPWLSEAYDCDLYLKLECSQPIGAFKIRGATYKISTLSEEERARGVITASAGNHAQGVAWGARRLGSKALIVMPKTAPLTKVQNSKALGAEVHLEGENYDEAYACAERIQKERGLTFIHAYQDPAIIAGQGGVGLEIANQLPDVDFVIGSIGGGGLMAGVSTAIRGAGSKAKVVGCQATGAASMVESIRKGRAICIESTHTFADGIKVKQASEVMRQVLSECLDETLLADDEEIAAAILGLMEKAKIVAEGAGALPLAALERIRDRVRGKKVALVVSGGNIDVNLLARIVERGLVQSGRRLRVRLVAPDRPGILVKLTEEIAATGANILQVLHERDYPNGPLDETLIDLTLETKGREHSQEIRDILEGSELCHLS